MREILTAPLRPFECNAALAREIILADPLTLDAARVGVAILVPFPMQEPGESFDAYGAADFGQMVDYVDDRLASVPTHMDSADATILLQHGALLEIQRPLRVEESMLLGDAVRCVWRSKVAA